MVYYYSDNFTFYISKINMHMFGFVFLKNNLQTLINNHILKLHSKYKMYHYSYGLFRKVAIYKCTCVCKCLSLSIYFQAYNSFSPVSIYCAYCLFIYVKFSCCPLRALNWSINWIELNWIFKNSPQKYCTNPQDYGFIHDNIFSSKILNDIF